MLSNQLIFSWHNVDFIIEGLQIFLHVIAKWNKLKACYVSYKAMYSSFCHGNMKTTPVFDAVIENSFSWVFFFFFFGRLNWHVVTIVWLCFHWILTGSLTWQMAFLSLRKCHLHGWFLFSYRFVFSEEEFAISLTKSMWIRAVILSSFRALQIFSIVILPLRRQQFKRKLGDRKWMKSKMKPERKCIAFPQNAPWDSDQVSKLPQPCSLQQRTDFSENESFDISRSGLFCGRKPLSNLIMFPHISMAMA